MVEAVIELSSTKTRLTVGFVKSVENTKEVYNTWNIFTFI